MRWGNKTRSDRIGTCPNEGVGSSLVFASAQQELHVIRSILAFATAAALMVAMAAVAVAADPNHGVPMCRPSRRRSTRRRATPMARPSRRSPAPTARQCPRPQGHAPPPTRRPARRTGRPARLMARPTRPMARLKEGRARERQGCRRRERSTGRRSTSRAWPRQGQRTRQLTAYWSGPVSPRTLPARILVIGC